MSVSKALGALLEESAEARQFFRDVCEDSLSRLRGEGCGYRP